MARKKKSAWLWVWLCVVIVAAIGAWWMYQSGFQLDEPTYIYIDADDDVDSIAQKTERQANPESMRVFHLYAGLLNLKDKIRTGRYEVGPNHTMLNPLPNISGTRRTLRHWVTRRNRCQACSFPTPTKCIGT